jgi:hypothetical protein
MASKVDICNIALSHVGAYRIQSITETTKEAKECNNFYEIALNAVLEDHDWSFARKRLVLALLTDTYSGWSYAYQYPTDCVCPRYIVDVNGTYTGTSYDVESDQYVAVGRVSFEIASDSTLSNRLILTDKADAELVYTAKVTDTNMFTFKFIEAFAIKLASYLAQPLKGDIQLRQSIFALYSLLSFDAKGTDANSENTKDTDVNSFVTARY